MNYYQGTNFEEIDLTDRDAVARHVLKYVDLHKQIFLATINEDGKPWITSHNWRRDNKFIFIWKSKKASVHSTDLRRNPNVAMCLTSETEAYGEYGLYMQGIAKELEDKEEIEYALKVRYADGTSRLRISDTTRVRPNTLEDVSGDAPSRMYMFTPNAVWLNENQHTKVAVDLQLLKSIALN